MTSTDPWLNFLLGEIGVVESPGGSNCTHVSHDYGSIGGARCYAWCCALQDLALEATFGTRLLGTAAVGQAMANAKAGRNDLIWLPADAELRVGDLPCFDYGGRGRWQDMHIEGVINPATQSRFEDVGGNVQNRCDRWWRTRRQVMGFIRPPFEELGIAPLPVPQEDDMLDNRVYYVQHKGHREVWCVGADPRIPVTHVQRYSVTEPVLVARGLQRIEPPAHLSRVRTKDSEGVHDGEKARQVGELDDPGAAAYGIDLLERLLAVGEA